jgi:hypothetical protein
METIQYRPLDASKSEIRLIELLPTATNTSTRRERTPRCNLIHASLNDKPNYVALSYTWGDPRDTEKITVDQSLVSVTRNLHSALKHLRYEKTVRIIWIDAICINQSDDEEKSWQVQLMSEIYQRASFVSIWLGPADATSDKVMDFLNILGAKAMGFGLDVDICQVRYVSEEWKKLASKPPSFRERSQRRVTVIDDQDPTMAKIVFYINDLNELYYSISGSYKQDHIFPVEGMASLFNRAWWSRIWVLQELSLAQKGGFVCGTKRLSRRRCTAALRTFKALGLAVREMHVFEGVKLTVYQQSVASANFDCRPTILLNMWRAHRFSPYPLLALLRITCFAGNLSSLDDITLDATDPRDKIYGLLGLAVDRDQLKELGVLPDYTRSCQDVYISVGAALLKQGHISALSLAQFPKVQLGLPSWAPDWSKPLGATLQGTCADRMTPKPQFNASGSLLPKTPTFCGIGAGMCVSVSGFIYDEVHDLGAPWANFGSRKDTAKSGLVKALVQAKSFLEELVRISFLRKGPYKDFKERIAGAARTASAEIGFNDSGIDSAWARIGNQRYRTAVSLMMFRVDSPSEMKFLDSEIFELRKSDQIEPGIDVLSAGRYCDEIHATAHRTKPFVTAKGHLGLGPHDIRPGDAIALVIGSQVPFVLREIVDGKYQIVGEAYVDGIMDGEGVVGKENVGIIELI